MPSQLYTAEIVSDDEGAAGGVSPVLRLCRAGHFSSAVRQGVRRRAGNPTAAVGPVGHG